MTTPKTTANNPQPPGRFRLPDPPEREPDEVTQFDHLFRSGNSYHLARHLGRPETTLVEADRWIVADEYFNKSRARYPDLLVAFDVDPEIYRANNGYVSSEQGKPPDLVLEVASFSTARTDLNEKRDYYAELGIPEYWRFDRTGEFHGARLAGERLVAGEYVAIEIDELPDGSLQGFSPVLNLYLRWEDSELVFYDPATNRPILTYDDQQARAEAAEARLRELEARLRGQNPQEPSSD